MARELYCKKTTEVGKYLQLFYLFLLPGTLFKKYIYACTSQPLLVFCFLFIRIFYSRYNHCPIQNSIGIGMHAGYRCSILSNALITKFGIILEL